MNTASARPPAVEPAGKVTQAFSQCVSTKNSQKACITFACLAARWHELRFFVVVLTFLTLFAPASAQTPGTVDTLFNPNTGLDPIPNNIVNATLVQPDGRIMVGGKFNTVGGIIRNNLARINADGALDSGFNLAVNNAVDTLGNFQKSH